MEEAAIISRARIDYFKAIRCWRANNLKFSLDLCNELTITLSKLRSNDQSEQMKQLVWFLKMKCLAESYYVNESLLLDEEDIENNEDQVRVLTGTRLSRDQSFLRNTTARTIGNEISAKRMTAAGMTHDIKRPMTGIVTGRMSSLSSRQSSRIGTSYRPLTTSLTATQTAFSRSTRPLLRYATNRLLAKPAFEYLYNAQSVTNKCPDYRQCLEFLNLVQSNLRKQRRIMAKNKSLTNGQAEVTKKQDRLVSASESIEDDKKLLGVSWLLSFGICYFQLKMNKQAEEYIELAVELDPSHVDPYTWLVKIYLRSDQPMKVLKTCELGLKHSKNPMLYNWLARVHSLMGDFYIAHSSLRESLEFFPTNIEALANVGHFAFYSDKQEQALKCFERIELMTANQGAASLDISHNLTSGGVSKLLNNLALCNFYCGFYHKVMPLFSRAMLNSPSKEVTSDIWYNVSFVAMSCGMINMAIACLKLSLRNNSQNQEAMNNLGVLKYSRYIDEQIHFANRLELSTFQRPGATKPDGDSSDLLENFDDHQDWKRLFDDAESHFTSQIVSKIPTDACNSASTDQLSESPTDEPALGSASEYDLPESLYNMAVIKRQRGQLLAALCYCNLYKLHDQGNHQVRRILSEIRQMVMHDS